MSDFAAPAPKVSIILATYNRASTLACSLRSVLGQTYRDFELLVVDDGSTDGTAELVLAVADPRVRLIRFESNRGVSAARNAGLDEARGEFIAFQDSDDEWLPEKLERQVASLEKDRDAAMAFCSLVRVDIHARTARLKPAAPPPVEREAFVRELLKQNFIWTQTWLVRAPILRELRFDCRLKRMVDWDLVLRIAQSHRLIYMPDVLVIAQVTPGSLVSDEAQRGRALRTLLDNQQVLTNRHRDVYALHCRRLAHWSAVYENAAQVRFWAWRTLVLAPSPKNAVRWLLACAGKPVFMATYRHFRW